MTRFVVTFENDSEFKSFKKILEHAKHDYETCFPDGLGGKMIQYNYRFLLQLIERIDNEN